ncbi:MAG TPA: PIN domain-containing protein [Tepidisphaeraceae bacterium]|jgi:predicted nucleic acid-binding protein|nr:PIN domain-containing protein [Tepidisphaeraceae bacterium]
MTHLDTNFLILALVPGTPEDAHLASLLSSREPINISLMAWTEFLCGPVTSHQLNSAAILLPTPEPFLPTDASLAAELFNGTRRRRNSLADCIIAAAAIRTGATLATNNLDDFRAFQPFGLRLNNA